MLITKTIKDTFSELSKIRQKNLKIGFVPTMGALHDGHLSLIKQAKKETDYVVVSIFVNPTQFNNYDDYVKYPRIVDTDIVKLEKSKCCDLVFIPDEKEIYPEPDNRYFDLGYLEEIMEGKYRPNHFQGVAKVVTKLFDIIQPDKAYFGKKDYQQFIIVKKIVNDFKYKIDIIACDIVRESHGLAMSSRNMRLSKTDFHNAKIIYETLQKVSQWLKNYTIEETKTLVKKNIETVNPFKVEYVEIADSETLLPIENISENKKMHCFVAVYCNDVRLIDNIEIKL
jgi:pantoate--beta-alanine ligase